MTSERKQGTHDSRSIDQLSNARRYRFTLGPPTGSIPIHPSNTHIQSLKKSATEGIKCTVYRKIPVSVMSQELGREYPSLIPLFFNPTLSVFETQKWPHHFPHSFHINKIQSQLLRNCGVIAVCRLS